MVNFERFLILSHFWTLSTYVGQKLWSTSFHYFKWVLVKTQITITKLSFYNSVVHTVKNIADFFSNKIALRFFSLIFSHLWYAHIYYFFLFYHHNMQYDPWIQIKWLFLTNRENVFFEIFLHFFEILFHFLTTLILLSFWCSFHIREFICL